MGGNVFRQRKPRRHALVTSIQRFSTLRGTLESPGEILQLLILKIRILGARFQAWISLRCPDDFNVQAALTGRLEAGAGAAPGSWSHWEVGTESERRGRNQCPRPSHLKGVEGGGSWWQHQGTRLDSWFHRNSPGKSGLGWPVGVSQSLAASLAIFSSS